MKKNMLLIDGHGLAFRGFYALPETLSASDGTPTNAVLGFMNMLMKALEDRPCEAIGIFFDAKGPTKRHELFENYKEGRKPTPEAFKVQLPLIKQLCEYMGIAVFTREGVEADDCIISTARAAAAEGWHVEILSADKDLFQAINEEIEVLRPGRGVTDFGLYNEAHFKEKFGFEPPLMADYLALVGDTADNIPGVPGIGEKSAMELVGKFGALESIYENLDSVAKARRAKLEGNRELAFRSRELIVPQPTEAVQADSLIPQEPQKEALLALCRRLGLKKLSERFGGAAEPEEETVTLFDKEISASEVLLDELLCEDSIAVAPADGVKVFFAASAKGYTAKLDLGDESALNKFRDWTSHGTLTIYGLRSILTRTPEFPLPPFEKIKDAEIANYLLHPDRGGEKGIEKALGAPLPSGRELALRLFDIYSFFESGLKKYDLDKLMVEIDLPLSVTLSKMTNTGIRVDEEMLSEVEKELSESIAAAQKDIEDYTGETINLSSPKQVGRLLFEELKLPPSKKNQSGWSTDVQVLEELSKLPEPLCIVPKKILNFREESKIRSGFVQPFLKSAGENGGIIHSTFDNLATGTGRLASRDPNVQNMPVFGDWADRFRSCFTPREQGCVFVAADYSQIELRVLADYTGEEKLVGAFRDGLDIHLETASWVFGLPSEDITPEQRRFAKVVNFGLLYGMSAFGLAQRLGVTRTAASQMVERYFAVLPKVREYMKKSVSEAKTRGYTISRFGRIRPILEISTIEGRGNNPIDRVAVNTPIQSTASDIAKIALFKFDGALSKKFPTAKTILQIHDSIICECKGEEADEVEKLLVETMESVNVLKVPLKAEPKRGASLKEV